MIIWGGGHGWTNKVAGFDPHDRYLYKNGTKPVTEGLLKNVAMLSGQRRLNRNDSSYTNICISRPALCTIFARIVTEYVEKNIHLDQVAVYLADTSHNHCECPQCQKKTPSNFYIMIMNELDEMLTARSIETKVQIVAYVDCMFPPQAERYFDFGLTADTLHSIIKKRPKTEF